MGGDTTTDLLARFNAEVEIMKPEIIVFSIGINDSKYQSNSNVSAVDLKDFEINITDLISKARKKTNRIVFVGLTPVDETKTIPRIHKGKTKFYENKIILNYDTIIVSVCRREGIKFINLFNLLKNSDLEDGLHPNSNGHRLIFDQVKPIIESLIH